MRFAPTDPTTTFQYIHNGSLFCSRIIREHPRRHGEFRFFLKKISFAVTVRERTADDDDDLVSAPLLHFFILSYPLLFSQGSFFVSNPPLGMCGFRIFCSWHNAKRGEGNDCGIYCAAGERTKEGKAGIVFSL